MGFRWVSRQDELEGRVRALEDALGALQSLRSAWLQAQGELEELHRRNLNTIRSLRRLSRIPQDERTDDGEGTDQGVLTLEELERARRRYAGG